MRDGKQKELGGNDCEMKRDPVSVFLCRCVSPVCAVMSSKRDGHCI